VGGLGTIRVMVLRRDRVEFGERRDPTMSIRHPGVGRVVVGARVLKACGDGPTSLRIRR
jgi:hypothetical protein